MLKSDQLTLKQLKIYLWNGVLACVGDAPAVCEDEALKIQTSSCYFHQTGIGDELAAIEVECLEI